MEKIKKIQKALLESEKPSLILNRMIEKEELKDYPFNMLDDLRFTMQSPKYHSEGVVWNHMMLVIDEGAKLRDFANDKKTFMFGLLLHDIGKSKTTKFFKGRWTSYDHDKVGSIMGKEFLNNFSIFNKEEKEKIIKAIKFHMHHIYIKKNLPFGDIKGMKKENDLNDLLLTFISDKAGRGGITKEEREEILDEVNQLFNKYKEEGLVRGELFSKKL
ncbi:MAG: HD domain-containing protein [Clostridium sp.]|uniref:HD domain-containing protein n=1 Tax=Clostridium TaxID=1485 RepID=UPI002152738E|nr:HD domain-containing protein [Clostridium sp. LY3-2]MCR6513274.1 HD domain-containing protein [Clostridium sp. LY3-2]